MQVATAGQVREMDRRASSEFGIPTGALMERAGQATFERIRERMDAGSIAILCGKGNNGGDGFVVARLARNGGFAVDCLCASTRSELKPDSAATAEAFEAAGGSICFADDGYWKAKLEALAAHDAVVDALLGTGAKGEPRGAVAEAIHSINQAEVWVLAVDIPSGIECDTGRSLGPSVVADETVTFGIAKPFLFQGDGANSSGNWHVADVGYPPSISTSVARLLDAEWVAERLPIRPPDSHKGMNGHVLIVAGSIRMRGAATLAAHAALRAGAGLVTICSTEIVCAAVANHLPEVLLRPIDFSPEDAAALIADEDRFDAALFGPGIGRETHTDRFLTNVFAGWHRPAVVDADALNAIASGIGRPSGPCVLTPHPGEAARLLQKSTGDIQSNRFGSVRALAEAFGSTVLLKGRHSLVAGEFAEILINDTGNPGLATGGSGDTLGGIIATLLAQHLNGQEAAACAMYWHGAAADEAAVERGSTGYTASEVAEALPMVRDNILQCES
jgi:hydroxyethylthiazole kinase-like uncharacterized protein yjeF